MLVLDSRPTVFVDVDETLVSFTEVSDEVIELGPYAKKLPAYVNTYVLDKIKEFAARDHQIVVWSAGGAEWAEEVVKALGLSRYVSVVMSKPSWFFDDQPALGYLPESNRIHLKFDGTYHRTGMYPVKKELEAL